MRDIRDTNVSLRLLKSKLIKEENVMSKIRGYRIYWNLYDIIMIYTNKPYYSFSNDEADKLIHFLRSKNYKSVDHEMDLQANIEYIESLKQKSKV